MNDNEKLRQIEEAIAAYSAGAANAGDPDAVISEVALILEGLDPTPHLPRTDSPAEYVGMGLDTAESLNAEALAELAVEESYDNEPMDDGEIRVGDVWDYVDAVASAPHTVLAVNEDYVSVTWLDNQPTTLTRDYFLRTRRLVSRKEN
jgi:hypothetical protein